MAKFSTPRTDDLHERAKWEYRLTQLLNRPELQIPSISWLLVYRIGNQTIPHNTDTPVSFSAFNNRSIEDMWNVAQPTRLIVAGGTGRIRLVGNIVFDSAAGNDHADAMFWKNGSPFVGMPWQEKALQGGHDIHINCSSGILSVVDGDYFELMVHQHSGSDLDLLGNTTGIEGANIWASLEVV